MHCIKPTQSNEHLHFGKTWNLKQGNNKRYLPLLDRLYPTIWPPDYRSDPVITGYYVSDNLTNGPSENGGVGLQVYHTITATTVPYSIVFKLYYIYYIPEHVKIEKAW